MDDADAAIRAPRKFAVTADHAVSRARIVMAIRYGLFAQKLFRACRPEKGPIYPRQICARPPMASALQRIPDVSRQLPEL